MESTRRCCQPEMFPWFQHSISKHLTMDQDTSLNFKHGRMSALETVTSWLDRNMSLKTISLPHDSSPKYNPPAQSDSHVIRDESWALQTKCEYATGNPAQWFTTSTPYSVLSLHGRIHRLSLLSGEPEIWRITRHRKFETCPLRCLIGHLGSLEGFSKPKNGAPDICNDRRLRSANGFCPGSWEGGPLNLDDRESESGS